MTELNHPYMKVLQSTLVRHYQRSERLKRSIALIKTDYALKGEFEKNEIELTIDKRVSEIEALDKVIFAREDYFKRYIQQFTLDAKECEDEFDNVIALANKKKDKIPAIKNELDNVLWDVINTNIEGRIKFYHRIKKLVS